MSVNQNTLKLQRIVMEVFGGCNYTCQMCPQSNPGRGKNFTRKMPIKEFEKINGSESRFIFESMKKDNVRITLSFEEKCKLQNKSTLLLSFEKFMRKTVDRRIEIFNKEMVDVNKLRIKNSPI